MLCRALVTKLSVNVNKIATLRNTRAISIPSVVGLSKVALEAGADGITVHPRPDERHIRPHDVDELAELLRGFPHAEYNIEGNPFHGLVEHCRRVNPHQATLVPDAREAFTSNHGFNLLELRREARTGLSGAIETLHQSGCRVSLFLDPIPEMMAIAKELGADRVELYTEPYARQFGGSSEADSLSTYQKAAETARSVGLGVNAGHDLNLVNLGPFLTRVGPLDEVSIGHALIADALELGLRETVRRYLEICRSNRA